MQLSTLAWAALDQLKAGRVWAGDLVSKAGKNELVKLGYATGAGGDYWLTGAGQRLAARMAAGDWHGARSAKN